MDRILLDIFSILSKFVNFRVAKMNGNNGTYYKDLKYRNSSHETLS